MFGRERFSREFQEDLRTLLSQSLPASAFAEPVVKCATEEAYGGEELVQDVSAIGVAPEDVGAVARVLAFLASELMAGALDAWGESEIELEKWLSALGASEEERRAFSTLMGLVVERRGEAVRATARLQAMRTGPPRIESANAVVDLRFVFGRAEAEGDGGGAPDPGEALSCVPVTMLELISERNGVRENHVFQLSEVELKQFVRTMRRAEARCNAVRRLAAGENAVEDVQRLLGEEEPS